MGKKILFACLFAVVIFHCSVATDKKDQQTHKWSWKSVPEMARDVSTKILKGCSEHVIFGAFSSLCTDFESDSCQSAVNNLWDAYHKFGLATATYSVVETFCPWLGHVLYYGAKVAVQIAWLTTTTPGLITYVSP